MTSTQRFLCNIHCSCRRSISSGRFAASRQFPERQKGNGSFPKRAQRDNATSPLYLRPRREHDSSLARWRPHRVDDQQDHLVTPQPSSGYREHKIQPPWQVQKSLRKHEDARDLDRQESPSEASDLDSTMTTREKNLFSKIFQGIIDQRTPESPDERRLETFSFEDDDTTDQLTASSMNVAGDYLEELPPSLKQEMQDAQILVKNRQDREDSSRARHSAMYIAHRENLFAMRDFEKLMSYVENDLFGPFTRGEIVLEKPSSEAMEFCRIYPFLVADVMCILRLSFRLYSSAIAIFEQMKSIGIESRVLGGKACVYNEAILARFEGWHDLGMVEELLREMEADAVPADDQTLVALTFLSNAIVAERRTSESSKAYWASVRPKRLEKLSKRIVQVERALQTSG